MSESTADFLKSRTMMVHSWLVQAGESITTAQFSHAFSKDGPPIGWHLWHMARFADRLQARLSVVAKGDTQPEIWVRDEIAAQWHLDSATLGVFESGMGQAHDAAQAMVTKVGQDAIVAYAKITFDSCNTTVANLKKKRFDQTYFGVLDYGYNAATEDVWATEPKESMVAQDLIFHISHGSRHVGMMEALRGLLGSKGTLSV